jgi:hypothetical protein
MESTLNWVLFGDDLVIDWGQIGWGIIRELFSEKLWKLLVKG